VILRAVKGKVGDGELGGLEEKVILLFCIFFCLFVIAEQQLKSKYEVKENFYFIFVASPNLSSISNKHVLPWSNIC
jgi:hypothetical protein